MALNERKRASFTNGYLKHDDKPAVHAFAAGRE